MNMPNLKHILTLTFVYGCALLGNPALGQDFTSERIRLGTRWLTYEQAMPILMQQLEGNNEQKSRAAEMLQAYGDTLVGTPAFKKLLVLVDEKMDFSAIDDTMSRVLDGSGKLPEKLTPQQQNAAEKSDIKLQALMAIVMSGSPEGAARLERMLSSSSATEQFIAREVKKVRDAEGSWKRGKIQTKPAVPKYLFGGKKLEMPEFIKQVTEATDSKDERRILTALEGVVRGGYVAMLGSLDGAKLMARMLDSTRELMKTSASIRDERRQCAMAALTYIDSLPPEKAETSLPFVEAAANDPESSIAEPAGILLQALRARHPNPDNKH